MQGPQAAKVQHPIGDIAKVQRRKCQLKGDNHAYQKPNDAPKGCRNHTRAHDAVEIFILRMRLNLARMPQFPHECDCCGKHHDDRVHLIGKVMCIVGANCGQNRNHPIYNKFNVIPHFASLRRPDPHAIAIRIAPRALTVPAFRRRSRFQL